MDDNKSEDYPVSTHEVDDDIEFWLNDENFKPSDLTIFCQKIRKLVHRIWSRLDKKLTWIFRAFVELGYTDRCLPYFIISMFLALYFGCLLHEGIHAVTALILDEIPVEIKLNDVLYAPITPILAKLFSGFITTESMELGQLGIAIIITSGGILNKTLIGLMPNIILFTIGFIWVRKGLLEKKPWWFGAGLVFTCSNLEIFIPHLHTDVYVPSKYLSSLIPLSENDAGIFTILIAGVTITFSYLLSKSYDKWQRNLLKRRT
jgi:hypothetical protein